MVSNKHFVQIKKVSAVLHSLTWFSSYFLSEESPLNRATAVARSSLERSNHDRMQEIGPGFSLFHRESLLSKVYRRDTRDSSS